MKNNNLQEKVLEHLLSSGFSDEDTIREVDLAGAFGVGVTPIRNALNNLEEKGFVERRKRKGTYLKKFSLGEICELYDLRSVLEGLAAKLLAGLATPETVEGLRRVVELYEEEKPARQFEFLKNLDYRFHVGIVEHCGNERLRLQVKESHVITKSLGKMRKEKIPLSAFDNPYTHAMVLDAVERGDGNAAENLMKKHVEWGKENIIKLRLAGGGDNGF